MKKYFIYLLSIVLFSCSSNKIENAILNDFIKNKNNKSNLVLVEESESQLKAIGYYETAYNERFIKDYFSRKIVANDIHFNSWPIDSSEIKSIQERIIKNPSSTKWKYSDFNNKITIKKQIEVKEDISKGISDLNTKAIILSKPLLNENKNYALVFYSSFGYFTGGETQDKVILFQKIKGKWEVAVFFYDPNIMN